MKFTLTLLLLLAPGARAELCAAELESVTMPLPDGSSVELWRHPEVFAPELAEGQLYGLRLMEAALAEDLSQVHRILIVGAGGGFEAVALAKRSRAHIDALDIDPAAVALARANVRRHGLESRIRVERSDLFAAARGHYDLILFNAPRPIRRAWVIEMLGPKEGSAVWERKITRSPDRFDPEGRLLKRCLYDVRSHLNSGGRFLLMSDEHIAGFAPADVRHRILSIDAWSGDAREGRFAIHAIELSKISN